MNFSAPFIRRPVATTLVMVAMSAFGVMAYLQLPVAALPDVDFPTISVSASLPGASAETMAASVATPLEKEFSSIDGVASMSSSSSLGASSITLQFDQDKDLSAAAQDVQAAISRATPRLPRDMPSPPSYRKVNPAEQPILILSVSSDTLPLHVVNNYAETRLAQMISTVRGVAQVQVFGSQKYAVRVQMDPARMAARNVGLDDVSTAIQAANVNVPTGTLYGPTKAFAIEANGQLRDAAAYESLAVAYTNGAPILLGDMGRALDSVENDKTYAVRGNPDGVKPAVILGVQKQPGANTVEVAKQVLALLPKFRKEIPASVDLEVLFDRSTPVEESVHDVQYTLGLTLLLVVLVIFLFLRRVTATLIPSLSMPLAILATFALMSSLGYSLNNLSLMALTLSVGFVVDDAIVVLENIVRHVEMGKNPMQAAFDATAEIGFTIVSMTVSLVAVFLPFLFMGGILGKLFQQFAVTMALAILVSGFVSLTLTPMMSARMLGAHDSSKKQGRFYRAIERALDAVAAFYARTLDWVLRHRRATMGFSAAVLAVTVYLFAVIPKGFLPTEDMDQLQVTTEAVEGISFEALKVRQQRLTDIIRRDPDVAAFMSSAGTRGNRSGANQGSMFIRLRPRADRDRSATEVAQALQKKVGRIPGIRAFIQVPPPIRIGGRITKSDYQLTLQSTDSAALFEQAPRLVEELGKSPVLADVTTDAQLNNPEVRVDIQRDRATALGVSVARIEDTLYTAYGSRQISTIFSEADSNAVILELDPRTQRDPTAIAQLYVKSDSGSLVPLSSVARITQSVGPLSVNHSGQLPAVTVSFNVRPGHALSEAVQVTEAAARKVLPANITASFQGTAEAFQSSLQGLGLLLLITIFVIYLVLGILYESYAHPITILSALPFAGFGALMTLLLFGKELDVYAFVGVILLVGLVKKNGIMMVDFAVDARKDEAVTADAAIREACHVRFRPIMMTTMAALLGTLPIAMGIGAGAESRQPLGLAVVGGLLFSQLLTLYVTPVFYLYMEQAQVWVRARRRQPAVGEAVAV